MATVRRAGAASRVGMAIALSAWYARAANAMWLARKRFLMARVGGVFARDGAALWASGSEG